MASDNGHIAPCSSAISALAFVYSYMPDNDRWPRTEICSMTAINKLIPILTQMSQSVIY